MTIMILLLIIGLVIAGLLIWFGLFLTSLANNIAKMDHGYYMDGTMKDKK